MLQVCREGGPCGLRRDGITITSEPTTTDAYRERLECRPLDAITISRKTIPAIQNATPVRAEDAYPVVRHRFSADRYAFAAVAQKHRYLETIQHATQGMSFRILSGMN